MAFGHSMLSAAIYYIVPRTHALTRNFMQTREREEKKGHVTKVHLSATHTVSHFDLFHTAYWKETRGVLGLARRTWPR